MYHQLLLLYALWNRYSLTLLDPERTHHSIQPGANKLHPLALGSTNPGQLSPICQIISHVFAKSQPRGMGIMGLISPLLHLITLGDSGTSDAATALVTGVFLQRVCEYAVLFCTTTTAFLLPFLNSVYVFCTVRPWCKEPSWVCRACTMTLICSPSYALPIFTGIIREEKGSVVSAIRVYINWSSSFVSNFSFWPLPTSMGIPKITRTLAMQFERSRITRLSDPHLSPKLCLPEPRSLHSPMVLCMHCLALHRCLWNPWGQ